MQDLYCNASAGLILLYPTLAVLNQFVNEVESRGDFLTKILHF